MVAKRLNLRFFGPACTGVAGLVLCSAITTKIAEQHFVQPILGKKLPDSAFIWSADTLDRLRATLLAPRKVPDHAIEPEPAATLHPDPTAALGLDLTGLREAIGYYKAGDLSRGDSEAKGAHDLLVQTLLEWVALRTAPREVGLQRLQAFQSAHPDWPVKEWIHHRIEAALYFRNASSEHVTAFFATEKPATVPGKLALARVLESNGQTAEARALVRSVWHDADLSLNVETRVRTEFAADLEKADHRIRADRLISKGDNAAALRAAALAGPEVVTLAKLRIAATNDSASDKMFAAIPAAVQNDPDYLFAKVQKLRRAEKFKEAIATLMTAQSDRAPFINGDEWWTERRLLARKSLDLGDNLTAYRLCAEHEALGDEAGIEAEFLAGWIALRFLNEPSKAARHFDKVASLAETPISTARAAYWQGRAAEVSNQDDAWDQAKVFYEKAAAETSTYYGQLARERLGRTPKALLRSLANPARGNARAAPVRAVELLFAIGEKDFALSLSDEIAQHVSDTSQLAALAEVITAQHDAHTALIVGKIMSQRRLADDSLTFPTFGIPAFEPLENSAAPAVIYSVARQESAFDPRAVSSAGAKGLMQLIPPTAKHTAEHAGLDFDPDKLLADASFNAKLGAAHLGQLLTEQGGSYILTFAAYNAGGKRVKQWMDAYGDPRSPGVDPIDWVERIPFTETRNYVQRVMENLSMYQASFTKPQSPAETAKSTNQTRTAEK
jgi:soluble lytic murein transglycosylase